MDLPICVVVPHMKSRAWFFERYTLPSIRANNPSRIIIEEGAGGACEKRNAGAAKASQPFIIFVDDDTVLGGDCLSKMHAMLEWDISAGYAYSGYTAVVWPGVRHPMNGNYTIGSRVFDAEALRRENYVDTTSLMRTVLFPGFDPKFERLQDWDLWLTMLGQGIHGRFIADQLFMKFNIDEGISVKIPREGAESILKKKHRLSW